MIERVADLPGAFLALEDYTADFGSEIRHGGDFFYKLEQQQTFREPGDPSWEAFIAGDWDRVLEFLDGEDRTLAAEMAEKDRKYGFQTRRLRVVEFPISPYLQWEMQFFPLLVEVGQELRVLHAGQVAEFEAERPLPEVVILGERLMYEVVYDTTGTPAGVRRIEDAEAIADCRADMARLFAQGEDLLPFFDREIAPLPPPKG